jgi:DNA polymerase-3 subunit epsilon
VRSYFAGGRLRRPVEHALEATERIETRPLGSELEASLVELELILRLRPDANRRSAHPERSCYLTLTSDERVPRLSVTSSAHPGAISVGPLPGRGQAQAAAHALRAAFGLRTCRPSLPEDDGSCLAGLVGSCLAPCRGGDAIDRYQLALERAGKWLQGEDDGTAVAGLRARMAALAEQRRFEQAAELRDRLEALESVRLRLARLRRAAAVTGVLLAADVDRRFVQAFACTRGRVVARRRLPRAGGAQLECQPLLAALRLALTAPVVPLATDQADAARLIAAAFARPGRDVIAIPLAADLASAGTLVASARGRVPFRR